MSEILTGFPDGIFTGIQYTGYRFSDKFMISFTDLPFWQKCFGASICEPEWVDKRIDVVSALSPFFIDFIGWYSIGGIPGYKGEVKVRG